MRRSIYTKFILGYLIFGLVGFLCVTFFSQRMINRYLVRQSADKLYAEAVLMAYSYEDELYYKTDINAGLNAQFDMVGRFLDSDIWLVDQGGKIVLDSAGGARNGMQIENFDPAGSGSYTIGTYSQMFAEEMLSVNAPISYNYSPIGYIVIHMAMSRVLESTNEILNMVYITAAIIFLLSFIILLIFTIFVYRPLVGITNAAREYGKGNLGYRIAGRHSEDEVGTLGRTLEYMAKDLSGYEESQRAFVANISHDFRSPLTSIKGYLEAILDGTIPPESRERYLKRVISETERLTKLTYSMISLSAADARKQLKRTRFDINRTIREVCISNENICMTRDIRFQLIFEDESEMVFADYGKIQQVLYNLIDNAIKFSDNSSVIYISTGIRHSKVFVSVKDTGCGIPKDSIKKIWDRFYKADASRGRDKSGTGLGLSIVRDIIQAHGEHIDVVSTEGAGTEFTFLLPVGNSRNEEEEQQAAP